MKKLSVHHPQFDSSGHLVRINCPHCGHNGVFEKFELKDLRSDQRLGKTNTMTPTYFGQRRCPDPMCHGHIFFIYEEETHTYYTYPAETVPFNKENIPERILKAFEEAIMDFANGCFISAAIMIRKTLEEICFDRGAKGGDLKKKIEALGSKIVIPKDLLEGLVLS
ncbi:MAG: DUF4145 domain-containing protein [Chryseolinea sp.]